MNEPNQDYLPPVRSDEFLPPISLWTRLGGLFLVVTIGCVFALSAVIKYNVIVKAPAIVRTAGKQGVAQKPISKSLIFTVRVPVQDIGKIVIGQKSELRISAYPYTDYGTIKGKVIAIAPVPITTEPNSFGAADSFSEVTIKPERNYLVKNGQQYVIQPKMEATAYIIGAEETVLKSILRSARLLTDL